MEFHDGIVFLLIMNIIRDVRNYDSGLAWHSSLSR